MRKKRYTIQEKILYDLGYKFTLGAFPVVPINFIVVHLIFPKIFIMVGKNYICLLL